jgi:WD40 repeat protein
LAAGLATLPATSSAHGSAAPRRPARDSASSKLLASAETDGTVRLWNPATGHPIGAPLHATSVLNGVFAVAFSPNGKLLASADADGTVRLWNPATGRPVGAPIQTGALNGVDTVAFSPDGKLLASGATDGNVRLWQVSLLAHTYTTLCTYVGPPTQQEWNQYALGEPQPKVCG